MTDWTPELLALLDGWKTTRVVVAGDFMLDHHVFGHADRLSPDAPVPVLAVQRETFAPGGAANLCLDLRALRCEVQVLGVRGDDHPGRQLDAALGDAGIKTTGLLSLKDRPTTVKQSLVGLAQHRHPQKMFRLDVEDRTPIDDKTIDKLLKRAETALKKADLLCLEDYNKGVLCATLCEKLIALAKKLGKPVLVDPASLDDYRKYRGATCITPNRTEAMRATGLTAEVEDTESLARVGKKLMSDLKLDALLLTLDRHGMLLLQKGKKPRPAPTVAREVYDVTGAGDMVLAMLAAARANDASWEHATELANIAAGLEVEQFGVVPIELDEVLLAVLERHGEALGKRRSIDQLLPELAAHRSRGKRIAFTNGCFDILHAGHVAYLRAARQHGDLLVVALNSDQSIKRLKGEDRPVNHEADRAAVLSELESIDYIVVFEEDTPEKLLRAIRPDVLVKGGDYAPDQVVGRDIVEAAGGRVELVPVIKGRSTTNIIRKVQTPKR